MNTQLKVVSAAPYILIIAWTLFAVYVGFTVADTIKAEGGMGAYIGTFKANMDIAYNERMQDCFVINEEESNELK